MDFTEKSGHVQHVQREHALPQDVIVDSPLVNVIDDLTHLAQALTGATSAFIALIDDGQLKMQSSVGCEHGEFAELRALYDATLAQSDVLVLPDIRQDARFANGHGRPTRFVAGFALRSAGHVPLGLVGLADTVPRDDFAPVMQQLLRVIARQVVTQIALRRHAQQLAEREQLLSTIFDAETECLKLIRPDGTLQFINRAGLALIEAESMTAVQDLPIFNLVIPTFRQRILDANASALNGLSSTVEYQIRGLHGTVRRMEMRLAPVRDHTGVVTSTLGVSRDITAQWDVEAQLRASEARLAAAQSRAHLGSWEIDARSDTRVWSTEMWRLHYQQPREDAPTIEEFLSFIHLDDRAAFHAVERRLPGATAPVMYEYRTSPELGPARQLAATVTVLRDEHGQMAGLAGTTLDVTEQRRADRRLRRLTESNAQGVMYWNALGDITFANDAFLRMVGYTREELDRGEMRWLAMTPPEYVDRDNHALQELAATGLCTPFEKEYVRKDGTRVPVLIGAANFEDQSNEGVCFILDLTEHKRLERQLLRAQRLESIGTLAGGIAHDLNNVLAPIMLSFELLRSELRSPDTLSLLDHISASVERGADMVRQLLTFARGMEGKKLRVDIEALLASMQRIVHDTFLKSIEMRVTIAPDIWTLRGDATQLHQLLLNLCVNARDAMPAGGTLSVRVENCVISAATVGAERELRAGSYIQLTVQDTGSGMPASIVDHIFDPFFSTKVLGKGTGLGLSTSLAIAKAHGGNIFVVSTVGRGTSVTVYLSALQNSTNGVAPAPRVHLPSGRGELILVVDDEEAIRRVIQSTLAMFGYRVIPASNGVEAIQQFHAHHADIALMLTDMMMPGMDGSATIHAIRQLQPTLPIIVTSGLTSPEQLHAIHDLQVDHILPKPFTVEQLLTMLHQILTNTRPA